MKPPERSSLAVAINVLALTGLLLIMAGLVWIMYHYTRPGPVDQAHIAERHKNLAELNAQSKDTLENYAWIDPAKGLVRLPVARAMELAVGEWSDPAAGRSNLLARLAKLTPASPPSPPTNNAASGALKP
jgi:hypothetical protein